MPLACQDIIKELFILCESQIYESLQRIVAAELQTTIFL